MNPSVTDVNLERMLEWERKIRDRKRTVLVSHGSTLCFVEAFSTEGTE